MAYRLRYAVYMDYLGAGMGPMTGTVAPLTGAGGGSGPSQTLALVNNPALNNNVVAGGGTSNQLNASDISTLCGNMSADVSAQLTSALTRLDNWVVSGGG